MVEILLYACTPVLRKELTKQLLYITGEMTSDMMREANDIRHTLFGAFSPTQNVTHKLRTQLEKVRNASIF